MSLGKNQVKTSNDVVRLSLEKKAAGLATQIKLTLANNYSHELSVGNSRVRIGFHGKTRGHYMFRLPRI